MINDVKRVQGQTGNIGILPQLLRDHFAMQQAESGNTPSSSAPTSSTSSSDQVSGIATIGHALQLDGRPDRLSKSPFIYPQHQNHTEAVIGCASPLLEQ